MINNSTELPYFKVTNNGPGTFAFSVECISGGAPIFAYSHPILPGNSMSINLDYSSTNIKFTICVIPGPYQVIPIYVANFNYAYNRCYLTSGTIDCHNIFRIPCFTCCNPNNCCCCCCR